MQNPILHVPVTCPRFLRRKSYPRLRPQLLPKSYPPCPSIHPRFLPQLILPYPLPYPLSQAPVPDLLLTAPGSSLHALFPPVPAHIQLAGPDLSSCPSPLPIFCFTSALAPGSDSALDLVLVTAALMNSTPALLLYSLCPCSCPSSFSQLLFQVLT